MFKCGVYQSSREVINGFPNWTKECRPAPRSKGFNECVDCCSMQERYNKILIDCIKKAEKNPNSDIHLYRNRLKRDGGKFVEFNSKGVCGLLVASVCANEAKEYDYVYIDKDLNVGLCHWVYGYEVLDEIPASFSVLNYLKNHQRKELYHKVMKFIEDRMFYKLITPIYL